MICAGIFADRESAVLIALIVLGSGLVVIGISFVRLEGPLELGASGLKTSVQPTTSFDPQAFVAAAAAVETIARELLPDTPDKEQKVNAVVGRTLRELITQAQQQGWTIQTAKGHVRFIHPQGSTIVTSTQLDRPSLLRRLKKQLNLDEQQDGEEQPHDPNDKAPSG